jgi:alpha-L-fucosidase
VELADREKIHANSQKEDDGEFNTQFTCSDNDLGSREKIKDAKELIWYPAEVDTSIRHNWFYHTTDDDRVRSTEELFDIYCNAVGGNSSLLLNIPPTTEGLIHQKDVSILGELGVKIAEIHKGNLINGAQIVSNGEGEEYLLDHKNDTYFIGANTEKEETIISFKLEKEKYFNVMILEEYIEKGQLVEEFAVEARHGEEWKSIYKGKTVGYRKICRFEDVKSQEIRGRITIERAKVMLRTIRLIKIK